MITKVQGRVKQKEVKRTKNSMCHIIQPLPLFQHITWEMSFVRTVDLCKLSK